MNKLTQALTIGLFATLLAVSGVAQETQPEPDIELETQQDNASEEAAEQAELSPAGNLPGSMGYSIGRFTERAELALATAPVIGSQDREAMVRANHAEKRVSEALALIEEDRVDEAEVLLEEYRDNLERANQVAEQANATEVQERIGQAGDRQVQAIEQAMENAPEEAQQGLQNAMENAQRAGPPAHAGPDGQNGQPEDVGPDGDQQGPPADAGPDGETGQPDEPAEDQPEEGEEVETQPDEEETGEDTADEETSDEQEEETSEEDEQAGNQE